MSSELVDLKFSETLAIKIILPSAYLTEIYLLHRRNIPHTLQKYTSYIAEIYLLNCRNISPPLQKYTSYIAEIYLLHCRNIPPKLQKYISYIAEIYLLHCMQKYTSFQARETVLSSTLLITS